jgi:hypothetical protein
MHLGRRAGVRLVHPPTASLSRHRDTAPLHASRPAGWCATRVSRDGTTLTAAGHVTSTCISADGLAGVWLGHPAKARVVEVVKDTFLFAAGCGACSCDGTASCASSTPRQGAWWRTVCHPVHYAGQVHSADQNDSVCACLCWRCADVSVLDAPSSSGWRAAPTGASRVRSLITAPLALRDGDGREASQDRAPMARTRRHRHPEATCGPSRGHARPCTPRSGTARSACGAGGARGVQVPPTERWPRVRDNQDEQSKGS